MKVHNMLLKQQMRECQDHSTEIILDLLINQMHEIWDAENYVVFLLTLDITKVYNKMICKHLIHMLRAKRISEKMINWVHFFMMNWIRWYKTFFNSKKYELIHLFCMSCRFNMQTMLQIKKTIIIFSTLIQVLDVWVNSQLW